MSILDRFRVDGQVAIVTGAGRGIGAASARRARRGRRRRRHLRAHRGAAARDRGRGSRPSAARRTSSSPTSTRSTQIRGARRPRRKEAFGRLDIVVNNVGGTMPRTYLDTSVGFLERAFHWNVSTAHALTVAAVPIMLENGGGAVVNIASVVGKVAGRGYLGLRHGQGRADPLHRTRRAGPRAARADERDRGRLDRDVGAGHRDEQRRDAHRHRERHSAAPARRDRRHRRRRPLPRLPRRRVPHRRGARRPRRAAAAEHGPARSPTCREELRVAEGRAVEHRQRRAARDRRHRRPSRTRTRRRVGVQPGQGRPGRRRARRPRPRRSASPRPPTPTRCSRSKPDCIVLHRDGRQPAARGDRRPAPLPGRRHQRRLELPGVPAVPVRRRPGRAHRPDRGRPRRPAARRCSSTASTRASPTTGCRWC